ncbi:tetratricopeptide repeat protein [Maribellus maritimus]|uniref:tetratricopeptide repeat protein n=1 Tax=Maribellus maritimus TaxID=2870838 RepID=UPI001EEC2532|nr:tetratricopeptide repeat protein [Maribellus maritimus]MCG6189017.1 tetratricopeptide repeat protein [Maribellus maritimus]
MKANIRKTLLFVSVLMFFSTFVIGQKVFKGTVYRDGEPAAGVTVEVHRGGDMMTSFDGKYELQGDEKSKWIRFTFIDDTEKIDIPENSDGIINFAFDGNIPEEGGGGSTAVGGVSMKSQEELVKEQNQDYINEYSLYTEFYKQDDYNSALPHWKKIYTNYPKSSSNVYIQGIKMYQSFVENASTPEEKNKFIDELMKVYDKRVEHFGEEGYVLGRKGTDWLKYKVVQQELSLDAQKSALKSGYEWISKSVELQGDKTEAPVLVLLMQTSKSLFKLGELSKEAVVMNYEKCNTIMNSIISQDSDADMVSLVKEKIQPAIESIFGTSGAADCEALVNIYKPQFQEKGNDIDFIKSMLLKLGRADCDESELFAEATEKLYELEPSALAAYNMARRLVKRNDIEKAKEYYKEAMEQETDEELLATYYMQYAKVLFSQSTYPEARSYARKVLDIEDNCEANMLLGEIYVQATRSFSGSKLEKDAIFWLAVDYFAKARRGEDCSIEAAQKIATYSAYFPNKEDAFMEGLQEGQTYKIGGWINESTKVRFNK